MMREVVANRLWLGNAHDARDYRAIFDAGIQAVVELALEEAPAAPPRELIWLRYPLIDGVGNRPSLLRAAVQAIVCLLREETPALVACSAGMGRTPVIAAIALSEYDGQTPEHWLTAVTANHPHDVAPGLWQDALAALTTEE